MEPPLSEDVPPFGRFFLPGPTEVHPDVLRAQVRAVIGHRGPAIKELIGELQAGLKGRVPYRQPGHDFDILGDRPHGGRGTQRSPLPSAQPG